MPEPYRPDIRWQMDWDNNGSFGHPESDVTRFASLWRLRWGSAADTPQSARVNADSEDVTVVGGVPSDTASGTLRIEDRDGRFDPDSARLRVNEYALRAIVPVRVLYDGLEIWRGKGVPTYGTLSSRDKSFTWNLTGTHGERMKTRLDVVDQPGFISRIEDDVPSSFSTLPGRDLPLGVVSFNGARIKYYEHIARLAGGWMLEDERGNWILRTLADAHVTQSLGVLSQEFERYDGDILREIPGLVRTRATLGSQYFDVVRDSEGAPVGVAVGRATHTVPRRGSPVYQFTMRSDDSRQIVKWEEPEVLGEATARIVSSDIRARTVRYRIFSAEGGEISVQLKAQVRTLQAGTTREFVSLVPEAVYGRRDSDLQPWLNQQLSGADSIVIPWLNNLTEPLEYVQVRYPEWQNDRGRLRTLIGAKPGTVHHIELETRQGVTRVVKAIILAVRLQGGFGRIPTRTLYGIVTRSRPPQPLTALRATTLSPFEMQVAVQLRVPDPSRTLHVSVDPA